MDYILTSSEELRKCKRSAEFEAKQLIKEGKQDEVLIALAGLIKENNIVMP